MDNKRLIQRAKTEMTRIRGWLKTTDEDLERSGYAIDAVAWHMAIVTVQKAEKTLSIDGRLEMWQRLAKFSEAEARSACLENTGDTAHRSRMRPS